MTTYPRPTELILSQIHLGASSQQGRATRSGEDRANGSPLRERCWSGLGESEGVVPIPEPHNSVCPGFCP